MLMNLFIFKTDVATNAKVESLKGFLQDNPIIRKWSVDLEDVDKVLKIETTVDLKEKEIISQLASAGFNCETLPD